jgi:two-component system, response regulator RegA
MPLRQVKRVLIVDDDQSQLAGLSRSVRSIWGATCCVASDVASAKQCASVDRFDLVLIDMLLTDSNGIDLLRDLRAADSDAWLFLMSGYNSVETTVRAMRAGADDVICKPFKLRDLQFQLIRRSEAEGPNRSNAPTSSIHLVVWEHVHRVYEAMGRNKSESARRLGIDRNTLKRWLHMSRPNG